MVRIAPMRSEAPMRSAQDGPPMTPRAAFYLGVIPARGGSKGLPGKPFVWRGQ